MLARIETLYQEIVRPGTNYQQASYPLTPGPYSEKGLLCTVLIHFAKNYRFFFTIALYIVRAVSLTFLQVIIYCIYATHVFTINSALL